MSTYRKRMRALRDAGIESAPKPRVNSWPVALIEATGEVYRQRGCKAAEEFSGRGHHAVREMAQIMGWRVDRRSAMAARAEAARAARQAAVALAAPPLARMVARPTTRFDISGEPILRDDYPVHRVIPATEAPRIEARLVASIFDLAEAL